MIAALGRGLRRRPGGARRDLNDKVFVVSFLSNVLVAALIVFLGDRSWGRGANSRPVSSWSSASGSSRTSPPIRRHLFNA
ncbi:MAG: DUF1290 domain-containing protein [Tetrasphaera sp.]|nr:DUF1290 domain-containing protein [Tetrasphaera sp.]